MTLINSNKNIMTYKHTEEAKEKMRLSRIGKTPMLGKHHSEETKEKIGLANTHDDAGNKAIHIWITKHKGKPQICVDCGAMAKDKLLQWSNINHKYQRKLEDYAARCCNCHKNFDIEYNGYKVNGVFKKGKDKRREKTQFKKGHRYIEKKGEDF